MRSIAAAAALVERAWALRRKTLTAPPGAGAGSRSAAGQVRRDLAAAVAICREAGAGRELSAALGKLGHVEQDAGRLEAARACHEEAVAVARNADDPSRLAHAVRHLGDVHRHAGRAAEAEACYGEALALYRDGAAGAAADLDHANAVRPMAILKEEQGQVGDALALWRRARDLYRAAGVTAGVAECEDHLSRPDRGHTRSLCAEGPPAPPTAARAGR